SINITNTGPSTATGSTLTNLLPSSVSLVSALPSQGSCGASGGIVTCALGGLNANNAATVTITVVPNSTGLITNTAIVIANEIDFVPANNLARAVSTIELAPAISAQPVSLTVTQG